mmetsp:Transcript_83098/g.253996  ORF Transcript_83098/g.253996 Transcript_83098/m.253996 type:complete len:239 (+) Transcript_83098:938-1654(+)
MAIEPHQRVVPQRLGREADARRDPDRHAAIREIVARSAAAAEPVRIVVATEHRMQDFLFRTKSSRFYDEQLRVVVRVLLGGLRAPLPEVSMEGFPHRPEHFHRLHGLVVVLAAAEEPDEVLEALPVGEMVQRWRMSPAVLLDVPQVDPHRPDLHAQASHMDEHSGVVASIVPHGQRPQPFDSVPATFADGFQAGVEPSFQAGGGLDLLLHVCVVLRVVPGKCHRRFLRRPLRQRQLLA